MSKIFEQGKGEVAKLCEYFDKNQAAFCALGRKEAHVRQDLIDPFFRALGWDVGNAGRVAPQYCEVVVEDSLDVEGQQKAPDYTFRVGTLPKFYVEAKKCGVNIFADPGPAYQLRRYGWSAKVAVSILTDFEELGVYDCTIRPRQADKASHARILYYRFDEYPDRWRELWDIFSREAVWTGAFDQYAASKRKRGTSEVDVEFLKEIEGWRDEFARNIALRNRDISGDELNRAVQVTIDRIVFLRMAEDRGLEPSQQLLTLCEQGDIYQGYMKLCRKADDKYNSGLFHFQKEPGVPEPPDQITPRLAVDDKVLKRILQSLYFAHGSPYEFKVLPVEILGTVYERFLGKVIRLTAGHQAKVEEKPEVRKAGGVYYTPAYIVDYIVRQTVGRQIDGKSPAQLAGIRNGKQPLRILDMACGSGSFLLGAYKCLLDHAAEWYAEHNPKRYKSAVYRDTRSGDWRLTITEKKRILTWHIFGVDIDPQAVEVSKLSLLLKVLEGESAESVGESMRLFHERALPNLSDNIKCGNSLIGPDYFTGKLFDKNPDAEEFARVNAFDWQREFPDAMKAGGFDCIIGNPPYVLLQNTANDEDQLAYLKAQYRVCAYKIDTYHLILEKAVRLTRISGSFGFIVPNTYLRNQHALELRRLLLDHSEIVSIRLFDYPVFSGASVDTSVIVAARSVKPGRTSEITLSRSAAIGNDATLPRVRQSCWVAHPRKEFLLAGQEGAEGLRAKIEDRCVKLGEVATAYFGIQTHDREAFVSHTKLDQSYRAVVDGANIQRYSLGKSSEYVLFRPEAIKSGGKESVYVQARIGVRQIGQVPIATWLPGGLYTLNTIYNIFFTKPTQMDLRFVLAIINSAFGRWYWRQRFFDQKRTFPKVKKPDLLAIPMPVMQFAMPRERGRHARVVTLVDSMLSMHKQLASAKGEAQRGAIHRQIEATDREIDRMIYDLYGLTKDEIEIVEGAVS